MYAIIKLPYTQTGEVVSIEFEFLSGLEATNLELVVPNASLRSVSGGRVFEFNAQSLLSKQLPESFYLQECANLPPKLSPESSLRFLQEWGPPFSLSATEGRTQLGLQEVQVSLTILRSFGVFAVDWFESNRSIVPSGQLQQAIQEQLATLQPWLVVGGAENDRIGVNVFGLAIAQWADDVIAGRLPKICGFCQKRFTKARGRSNSGRYRTSSETKFCSHSCSNREGNRRRRIQRKEDR